MTDDAIYDKALGDVKFRQIEGNGRKFSQIELSNGPLAKFSSSVRHPQHLKIECPYSIAHHKEYIYKPVSGEEATVGG